MLSKRSFVSTILGFDHCLIPKRLKTFSADWKTQRVTGTWFSMELKGEKKCFRLEVDTNLKSRPAPAFERGISEFSTGPSEQCRMSQTDQQVAAFL